jgi:hypothetical protein
MPETKGVTKVDCLDLYPPPPYHLRLFSGAIVDYYFFRLKSAMQGVSDYAG